MTRRRVVLAVLAAVLVVHAFVTSAETEDAYEDGGRIVRLEGGDLHVREAGSRDAPAVVLLHGYGASSRWWERVAPSLARDHRVLSFDLLGNGASEKPDEGYSSEQQAGRVARALEELGVDRALVAGHSMGGGVTIALAEDQPDLVTGLAVIGTPPRKGFAELPISARLGKVPVLGQALSRLATDGLVRGGLESAFAEGTDVPDEFVADFRDMTYSSYKSTQSATNDLLEERPAPERLRPSEVPLLVVFGAEDDLVDPDAAEAWRDARVATRVEVLPDTGHSPQWERPREVVRLLLDFERGLSGSGR